MIDDPCTYLEARWRRTRSQRDLDELTAAYVPHALTIAHGMRRNLPSSVDGDALVGAALEALTAATRSFDPERGVPLSAWVRTRVRFGVIDAYRGSRHRREISHAAGDLDRHAAAAGDPLTALADRDEQADAVRALAQLPEGERLLVDASIHGVSVRNMARALGISEGRASRVRSRGLDRLREALGAA